MLVSADALAGTIGVVMCSVSTQSFFWRFPSSRGVQCSPGVAETQQASRGCGKDSQPSEDGQDKVFRILLSKGVAVIDAMLSRCGSCFFAVQYTSSNRIYASRNHAFATYHRMCA